MPCLALPRGVAFHDDSGFGDGLSGRNVGVRIDQDRKHVVKVLRVEPEDEYRNLCGDRDLDFIVDGVYRYTITVTQDTPIRLPGGFLGLEWQLDVRTTRPIQSIFVAESIEELRGAFTR